MLWFSIELVHHTIMDIGEKMSPGVRRILTLIAGIRRWTFLPSLVVTVARVMFVKGADSVSSQIFIVAWKDRAARTSNATPNLTQLLCVIIMQS